MTGPESYEEKLEDLVAGLERLNVESKVKAPKQEQELQSLLDDARSIIAEMREERQRREERELLERLITEIAQNTAAAHDRLTASEARLKYVEGPSPGQPSAFPMDPQILEEGEFLKAQLSGPPTDHDTPRFFKDASHYATPDGLEVLSQAIYEATPSYTAPSKKE